MEKISITNSILDASKIDRSQGITDLNRIAIT